LVERLNGIEEVRGSNPLGSILLIGDYRENQSVQHRAHRRKTAGGQIWAWWFLRFGSDVAGILARASCEISSVYAQKPESEASNKWEAVR
jgi:hypothetical protein